MMEQPNLGYLYTKDYYGGLDFKDTKSDNNAKTLKERAKKILDYQLPENREGIYTTIKSQDTFTLTTTYPGLLVGSGYAHDLENDEAFKIGFYFDYTTGLPVIPGSSVKGMLKSAFAHPEYIQEQIKKLTSKELDTAACEELKYEIFEGRDIFYDAEIERGSSNVLEDDYLTPHDEKNLQNPVPLRFVKVPPDMSFRFLFDLKDGTHLSRAEKLELFQAIIEDFGLGAKTNVGYGKLCASPKDKQMINEEHRRIEEERKAAEEKKKTGEMEPHEIIIYEYEKSSDNPLPVLINDMRSGDIEEEHHYKIALYIKSKIENDKKQWINPKGKQAERKAFLEEVLQQGQ